MGGNFEPEWVATLGGMRTYAAIDFDLAEQIREATADAKYAEVWKTRAMREAATVLTEAYTEARLCCAAGLIRWKSQRKDLVGA